MMDQAKAEEIERQAREYVSKLKQFNSHLLTYVGVITLLFVFNLITNPSYLWAFWPAAGWGIAIIIQAVSTFDTFQIFGRDWEEAQVKKRIKKLSK